MNLDVTDIGLYWVNVLSITNFLFFIVFNAILLVLPFNAWCEGKTRPTNESSKPQLVVQLGHSSGVLSVVISPDGKFALSGGDNTIKLWEIASGREIRTFTGHSKTVRSVAFTPDGRHILSNSLDGVIKLWEIATGKEILTFTGHPYTTINSIAISPDGKYLLTGGYGGLTLWDINTGEKVTLRESVKDIVNCVAFSPDGKYALSTSLNKPIKLWEIATGKETRTFTGHSNSVESIAFTPDGRYTLSGSTDNTIRLWDITIGKEIRTFTGHSEDVTSVAFSPDGRYILSGSIDNTTRLWDAGTGKEIRAFTGHSKGDVESIVFSPDGKYALSANEDKTLKLWEVDTGKEIRTFTGHSDMVTSVAISRDGRYILSGSFDKTLKLWDIATGKEIRTFTGHSNGVLSVAFSLDGKHILSGSVDKTLKLWDIATGKETRTFTGHSNSVESVAFSTDGKHILSGSKDSTLKLWDIATGWVVHTFTGHSKNVRSVAISPDGRYALSGSNDKTTILWDITSGTWLAKLISFTNDTWVVIDPEGRFDTNNLEDIKGLHWIMPDDPMQPLPLEIFMKDYYEPRLLPRILNGEKFNPVKALADLNRLRPQVKISDIDPDKSDPGKVTVTIEISKAENEAKRAGRAEKLDLGINDLKLFRDGQLVGYAPNDGGEIVVNALTGKKTISFPGIRLPRKKDIKEVLFSAYAFNADRIKSATDRKTYKFPENVKPVKGNAYIVTIGVNAYENPVWDLQYAGNDARKIQSVTHQRLLQTGQFANIVQIPLISDYEIVGDKKIIRENLALKLNIQAVFELLAGKTVAYDIMKNIPNADKIKKAEPEDMILISFSGHGYVDKKGIFYAFPYDISKRGGREVTPELLNHLVSSDELTKWIRDVDGGEIVMIVDACHSAASVEGEGFKPGPMGSRGLGQLAYDKGMRILAASQADDVALESDRLKQGLLTYALVHDGIEAFQADFKPKDKTITLTEWLLYGVQRVPDLYEEVKKGNIQSFGQSEKSRGMVVDLTNDSAGFLKKKRKRVFQQPSLFDFMVKTGVTTKEVLLSDIQ